MKRIIFIAPLFIAFFVFTAIGVFAQEDDQGQMQDPTLRILNQIKERSQNRNTVEGDDMVTTQNDEEGDVEKPLTAEERRQKIQELKTMAKEKKCEVLGERIDAKIERYSAGYTKYTQSFENLHQRVDDLLILLEGQDYDTEALQANNNKLMEYIDDLKAMHEDFVTKMDGSRESSCLDNAKQFQNIVKEANALITQTRTMAKEMHTFVREELRPSLQQLRLQIEEGSDDKTIDNTNDLNDEEGTEGLDNSQEMDDGSSVQGVEDYDYNRNFEF